MDKLKRIIIYILAGFAAIYFGYCIYFVFTNVSNPTYKDTGVIVSKGNDEVAIKHGTKTILYLNVQFDNSGFQSIEAEPTTYFKYKKGDRITVDLYEKNVFIHKLNYLVGVLVMGTSCFILLVMFIHWLIS